MPSNQFDDQFDFITISDFRAGIWSQTRGVVSGLATPAPPGAAQASGTFRCIALASGGLAPLPRQDRVYDVPLPDTDPNAALGYFNVDGFTTFGPVGPNATTADADDFFLSIEYLKTGGVNRVWTYYRVDPVTGTNPFPSDQLQQVTSTQAPTTEAYVASTWVVSRMNPTSPFLTPGTPVLVTQWCPPAFAADRHVLAFPSPASPGATGVVELCIPNRPTGAGETQVGDLLGHQGRIVMLEYLTNQFGARAGDSIPTNEQVSWSDPSNSYNAFGTTPNFYTIGTQQQVFALELPNGYGAWGSISAGELFLVKHNGGGLIVSGDLNSATVTRLPGVVSAGGMASRAASTPNGLFYYSRFRGVYVWRGADTSEKISTPLDDQFPFYTPGPDKLIGVTIDFQNWGDWLVCTNNYLYDTVNGGWWRLDDPSSYIMQWVAGSFYGELLYAIPIRLNNTTKVGAIRRYNRRAVSNTWQWTSQPIHQYINRLHENRECVIIAEGTSGSTLQVLVTNIDGSTATTTFTLPAQAASQAVRLRKPLAAHGYDVVVRVIATGNVGSDPAPILHSISLGIAPTQEAIDK